MDGDEILMDGDTECCTTIAAAIATPEESWSYFAELRLHPRKDHDDGHHGPQQQEEGENQPRDGGVIGGRTAAAEQTWCWSAQTGGLAGMEKTAS